MSGASNGRVATCRNPYQAMELPAMALPRGEYSLAEAALEARLATVGRELAPETALAVRTAFLAGWRDCWLHHAQIAAREARSAMDGEAEGLNQGVVVAQVEQLGGRA